MKKVLLILFCIFMSACSAKNMDNKDNFKVSLDDFYNTKPIVTDDSKIDYEIETDTPTFSEELEKELTEEEKKEILENDEPRKVSKVYNSLDEISEKLNLTFLNVDEFTSENYKFLYEKSNNISLIHIVPRDRDIETDNFYELKNKLYEGFNVEISWINNKNQESIPYEAMGNVKIAEEYKENDIDVIIIYDTSAKPTIYSGFFKFEDKTYSINNIEDLEKLKDIIGKYLNN